MSKLANALAHVERGFTVFPVGSGSDGKEPFPGFKWGDQVRQVVTQQDRTWAAVNWWTRWPDASVAVACKPSGILVIDCDPPKPPDTPADGIDEFLDLCKGEGQDASALWDTYIVRTGRGGLHFYYQWDPNYTSVGSKLWKCTNVDIRGNGSQDGNYVLGAGSSSVYGPYVVEHDRPPAPCPPWIGQLVSDPPDRHAKPITSKYAEFDSPGNPGMQPLLDYLAAVPPGDQDNRMNSVTWQLKGEGHSEDDIREGLLRTIPRMQTSGDPWTEQDVERHLRKFFR